MLKKIFKAVTAFTILVGCYLGYVHVFAVAVRQWTITLAPSERIELPPPRDSHSKLEAIAHAAAVMGKDHWSAAKDLAFRYYNAERGYWMYAKEYEQINEENGVRYDGKRIRLKPFLVISTSHDGKNTKTIMSDVAILDMNQSPGFTVSPDGEALKVLHVHLEPNVQIRDDKGTSNDKSDDMKVAMRTLDYDEPTQQITTESYVVIEDAEMVTSGTGMLVQLRKVDASRPGGSSGFDGAERLELFKNVRVVMHDVGKSGLLPATSQPRHGAKGTVEATVQGTGGKEQEKAPKAPKEPPTPLVLTCDSKMQVFLPETREPVAVGPPAPPAPTLAQFDRNVVVLRGEIDDQPDQLTCDTLRLTLVPPEKPAAGEKSGLFGNLTLQRAHGTGHAVWLYLPSDGVKLRCNELIHMRLAPIKPDLTYFRGDLTRPLEIWKVDVVQEVDSPDEGKVKSVTYIRTVDATMYDKGTGFDSADVVANGPGRLETRPDRDQPVDKIAIWQDKLRVQNDVGADGQVTKKMILLTGKRPCFIDQLQHASVDSGQWIKVFLEPRAPLALKNGESPPSRLAGPRDTGKTQAVVTAGSGRTGLSVSDVNRVPDAEGSPAGAGGGGFEIRRLLAFRDVHMLAPAKTMAARQWLDATFVDAVPAASPIATTPAATATAPAAVAAAPAAGATAPSAVASTTPSNAEDIPGSTTAGPGQSQVAANDQAAQKPAEPPIVGSADRMWVKIEMKPKVVVDTSASQESSPTKTASTAPATTGSTASIMGEKTSEIREAWLWGSVAMHQDPAEGKTKGQEASGEAIYLDNRGKDKAITFIYQREPNETTYLPGPLPPARVENEQKIIKAAGVIAMNQATDQAWVEGPGTLTQFSQRASSSPVDSLGGGRKTANATTTRTTAPPTAGDPRPTSLLAQDGDQPAPADRTPDSKPTTRAGRPLSEIVPSTIRFSEGMEFNGRTVDPEGKPAGRADFFGIVTAQLEDALLHCEERMITFTDQVVPLAQLGALSSSQPKPKPTDSPTTGAPADNGAEPAPGPQLALIKCYRNAILISRKVDPLAPILLQQQRVEADELLDYDRRTGRFWVPQKGKVFLYDRSDNSRAQGMNLDGGDDTAPKRAGAERTVTPASNRSSTPSRRASDVPATKTRDATEPRGTGAAVDPKADEPPPLVLTQIHFIKEMRGYLGSGGERDEQDPHWYEFFGDVQLGRAKVLNSQIRLNFDRLPADGFFLTGQTLRVRTEPPPVGSPPSTPARDYVKAWENAGVNSGDKVFQTDVITYDSEKDLVYAYGEHGRGVTYAQQHAMGQPSTLGNAQAIRLNPKTGAAHFIDNSSIQLIDKNTGVRPVAATAADPEAKKKKPAKNGFRVPANNVERRGFTGQ